MRVTLSWLLWIDTTDRRIVWAGPAENTAWPSRLAVLCHLGHEVIRPGVNHEPGVLMVQFGLRKAYATYSLTGAVGA